MGKYLLAREDDPNLSGIFLASPRLTAEGQEQADAVTKKFPAFRCLGATDVIDLLLAAELLPRLDLAPALHSDLALVITEDGLALTARELDPKTRHAKQVVVWTRSGDVPEPTLELVKESALADGLAVAPLGSREMSVPVKNGRAPTVVTVRGSTSDFEYQLPTAPKFFVGRKDVTEHLQATLSSRENGGVVVVNAKSGWGKSSLALRLERVVQNAGGVALIVDSRTADSID